MTIFYLYLTIFDHRQNMYVTPLGEILLFSEIATCSGRRDSGSFALAILDSLILISLIEKTNHDVLIVTVH